MWSDLQSGDTAFLINIVMFWKKNDNFGWILRGNDYICRLRKKF